RSSIPSRPPGPPRPPPPCVEPPKRSLRLGCQRTPNEIANYLDPTSAAKPAISGNPSAASTAPRAPFPSSERVVPTVSDRSGSDEASAPAAACSKSNSNSRRRPALRHRTRRSAHHSSEKRAVPAGGREPQLRDSFFTGAGIYEAWVRAAADGRASGFQVRACARRRGYTRSMRTER
ncbi:hypothetical protein DFH11DRAFT_1629499, partial [Phellopilus nigrolimitatus]